MKHRTDRFVNRISAVRGLQGWALLGVLVLFFAASCTTTGVSSPGKVISEKTVTGFKFPESVGCDVENKSLYVGNFGGTELKPAEKDNQGYISRVSLDGTIIEERFLPVAGTTMNKPKGIWVDGNRLWVTDIDGVWQFDTWTKQGKKLDMPGIVFANDVALVGSILYVSDNRQDALYSVEPGDFLSAKTAPKVSVVWKDKGINPNGVYPSQDGALLMVGFKSDKEPRGIHSMYMSLPPGKVSEPIGRLDGLHQMLDGSLLVTDWNTGSVFSWSETGGMKPIATGFKGPADLCAYPNEAGLMVAVPDLVKSELRLIQLGN